MSEKTIKSRVINKHDTAANWAKATTFIPMKGEIIVYDIDSTYNYERIKIGDGVTNVNSLPFVDDTKVDKVDGKGLSTNDYTTAEKNKLAGIAAGATKVTVDSALSTTSTNPVQNKLVTAAINNLNTLVGDTSVATQITNAVANKVDKVSGKGLSTNDYTTAEKTKLANVGEWTQIYDSGAITSEVNSISDINVADYKNLMVAIKCVNTTNSAGSRAGAVIFTGSNEQDYAFNNLFSNLIKSGTTTSGAMAKFKIVNGFIICETAMRAITADGILSDTEGTGIDTLAPVSGGLIKCTSTVTKMAVSSAAQSATHFYGVGSRVVVWGCKV